MLFIDPSTKAGSANGIDDDSAIEQSIIRFMDCAHNLSNMILKMTGHQLTVLTNREDYLLRFGHSISYELMDFTFDIPKDIAFYASHHKIDVFRHLGSKSNEYSVLIDNDVACLNDLPGSLKNCVKNSWATYSDITRHSVEAYGLDVILRDKEYLMGSEKSTGLWCDGGYLGGTNGFFTSVYELIDSMFDDYLAGLNTYHHVGDEFLMSVAIEKMIQKGTPIFDISRTGFFSRYWSVETRHNQLPWESFKNNCLLHLPADKPFLAMKKEPFLDPYLSSIRGQQRIRSVKKLIKKLINKR